MMITFSHRFATVVAGAAIAVGVQALAGAAGAATAGGPGGTAVAQDVTGATAQAAAARYWTPARMAAALRTSGGRQAAGTPGRRARQLVRQPPPAPRAPGPGAGTAGRGLSWTRGGAVAAATGKVFFTLGGQDYVCSGTLVGGEHPDVVLTAAHCVTSGAGGSAGGARAAQAAPAGPAPRGGGQWATNWIFVPGYRDGLMPYGELTARRFFVIPGWTGPTGGSERGEQYDVAFVQVTTATRYGTSSAAKPPPGLPVEFASSQDKPPLRSAYVFGYPAEPPYAGLYLDYCAGAVSASGGSAATPCAMTAGDSGGPWLAGFSPQSGTGRVAAVSTYKISDNMRVLYGAVLGPRARALYALAVRSAR
jgi:V8-like Glu-specific endopeptidase